MRDLARSARRRHPLARLGLCLLLAIAGCGSPQERAAKALVRYENYYAQHDMLRARIEIRNAIREQDDVADYWNKLGRVELALNKYFNAYSAYSRALELDKGNIEAMQAVAELSYSGGSPDDAVKYADKMLLLDPGNLRMLFVKGSVAFDTKKYDDARAIALHMLSVEPGNEGAAILLARVQYATGDSKAAIATLENSVSRDGPSRPKFIALLDFYSDQQDLAGIDATYARLFKLQPRNIDLRLEYARVLYESDRPDRALAIIDRLQSANPHNTKLQQKIVDLWMAVGSKAIAIDQVRRFAEAGNDQMKVALGQLAVDQKRFAEAEAILRPFVDKGSITPENVQANTLYAAALAGLGKRTEALARADKVLEFDKTNPQALLLRIQISIDRKNLGLALNDAQILGRDNPDLAAARVALAQVYALRKEQALADGVFARAADELPANADLLRAYIAYLIGTDRRQMALDIAENFTRHNADSLEGWKIRADLCLALGDERCAQLTLDALGRLRGGDKARAALSMAMNEKHKDGAPLSGSLPAMLQSVLGGQVSLEATAQKLVVQGRAPDAEKITKAVIVRQPQNELAKLVLANLALLRGDRQGAEAAIQGVIERDPTQALGYRDLARLRFGAGDRSGAFAALAQGLARLSSNDTLLFERATFEQASGSNAAAAKSYRLLLRQHPDNLIAINNLIYLLSEDRSPPALQEAVQLAKRIESEDLPAFLDTRGWLLLRTGNVAGAVSLLRRAIEGFQPPSIYRYHLAEALIAGGDAAGARAQAQAALASASGNERWIARARDILRVR
ncbi:Tetratricopeptide repeat-containing protein [Sphingomonas sp. YR710]|nr:Tetratricopeptide repeat-containing protein [Sphingomonas sp. YR710]